MGSQYDSNDLTETSLDPSCVVITTMNHTPSPLAVHPTPPPAHLYSTSPKPAIVKNIPVIDATANSNGFPHETSGIFDYVIWSGINLVLGAIVLGIPAFLFSLQTRKYKRDSDVKHAKIFSRISLAFNVTISFLFTCGMIFLIHYYNGVR